MVLPPLYRVVRRSLAYVTVPALDGHAVELGQPIRLVAVRDLVHELALHLVVGVETELELRTSALLDLVHVVGAEGVFGKCREQLVGSDEARPLTILLQNRLDERLGVGHERVLLRHLLPRAVAEVAPELLQVCLWCGHQLYLSCSLGHRILLWRIAPVV